QTLPAPPHAWGGGGEAAGRAGASLLLGIIPRFGDHGGGETPVPFPNTVVKPSSADGTVGATRRESRSLPSIFKSCGPPGRRDLIFIWPARARPAIRGAASAATGST